MIDILTGEPKRFRAEVEKGLQEEIKITFRTLLLQKKVKQQALADFCGVSKSYISPVVNGKYIPDLRMRLKIASFFECDSTLIWRNLKGVEEEKLIANESQAKPMGDEKETIFPQEHTEKVEGKGIKEGEDDTR